MGHLALSRVVEAQIVDETEVEKPMKTNSMNKMAKVTLNLKLDGGIKNIVLNTDLFEQKIEGSRLMSDMAESMGVGFLKYAEVMLPTVVELLSIKSSK